MHNLSVKPGLSVKTEVRGLNPGKVKFAVQPDNC